MKKKLLVFAFLSLTLLLVTTMVNKAVSQTGDGEGCTDGCGSRYRLNGCLWPLNTATCRTPDPNGPCYKMENPCSF